MMIFIASVKRLSTLTRTTDNMMILTIKKATCNTKNDYLFLPCREKFQNYLADLAKHRKQLEEKNNQLVEELQGQSK